MGDSPLEKRRRDAEESLHTQVVLDRADDGTVWLTVSALGVDGDATVTTAQMGPGGRLWLIWALVRTLGDEARHELADRLQRVRRG